MSDKTVILYVSHYEGMNGAPRSMLEMIQGLDKDIFTPMVIIPASGPLEKELRIRHIKYFIVPFNGNYRIIGKKEPFKEIYAELCNLKAVIDVVELIKKYGVDIVHSNSTAVDIGAVAALITGTPHIFHARELMEEDFRYEFCYKRKMRWLLKKSDVIVAISKCVNTKLQRVYGVKAILLYDGILIERYFRKTQTLFSGDKVNLLLCGDIFPHKGQMDAVVALDILKKRGYDKVYLTLVGQSNKQYLQAIRKAVCKAGLEDQVRILPFCSDLSMLRGQTDISLTCSRMEALGRVTIEAMLAGNSVVGADTGGTKELIGDNQEFGYLYSAGSGNDLADVLEYVIHHADEAESKMVDAQRMIMKKVGLKQYNENLNILYRNLLKC